MTTDDNHPFSPLLRVIRECEVSGLVVSAIYVGVGTWADMTRAGVPEPGGDVRILFGLPVFRDAMIDRSGYSLDTRPAP